MNLIELKLKTIRLRLIDENDASFVLSLRLDPELNSYLSSVSGDLNGQIKWIREYKSDEQQGLQYYFIIERLDGVRCGTVRIYDIRDDSFSWGSWILNNEKTRYAAIESAMLVYKCGFDFLGFKQSHFEVMKGNSGVIRFHERMGAERINEDSDYIYYRITKKAVELKALELKDVLS